MQKFQPHAVAAAKAHVSRRLIRLLVSFGMLFSSLLPSLALSTIQMAQAAPAVVAQTKAATSPTNSTTQTLDNAAKQKAQAAFAQVPLSFEENKGQVADPNVKYVARGQNFGLSLAQNGAFIGLSNQANNCKANIKGPKAAATPCNSQANTKSAVVQLNFAGTNANAELMAGPQSPAKANYFTGNQSQWHTDIATYSSVTYKNLYNGIDVTYSGGRSQLQYTFTVAPGADASQIRLTFSGADSVQVGQDGSLSIQTAVGTIHQAAPSFYQNGSTASSRVAVSGRYVSTGKNSVSISPANYDHSQTLTFSPVLDFSTYLGSGNPNNADAYNVATDGNGDIFISGYTAGGMYPTANAFQLGWNDLTGSDTDDVFVAEFNPTKSGSASLQYLTYLGGGYEDEAFGLVYYNGKLYLGGYTDSGDFPVTANAYQTSNKGGTNNYYAFFVSVLDPTQSGKSQLSYSTYLAGTNGSSIGLALAVDNNGNAIVAGYSLATDFPLKNAYQNVEKGGVNTGDIVVAKINPSASGDSSLLYSTYFGGSGNDGAYTVATDSSGKIYLTGFTYSSNFVTTTNALQPSLSGTNNAFVTVLDSSQTIAANQLVYSSYLGGNGGDYGNGIATDASGNIYVFGLTGSSNFPTTTSAYQTTFKGNNDFFVTELKPQANSTTLLYSTYLGSDDIENIDGDNNLTLGPNNEVYVAGYSYSYSNTLTTNPYPTTANAYQTKPLCVAVNSCVNQKEAVVSILDTTKSGSASLVYSTFLAGSDGYSTGSSIAVDANGKIYLSGFATASDYPTTANAYASSYKNLGAEAAVATILDPSKSGSNQLVYSSYLPATLSADAYTVAVDSHDNVLVGGNVYGFYPATSNAYQNVAQGGSDVFVAKLDPTGSNLLYYSYFGGSYDDTISSMVVDSSDRVYFTGYSNSKPTTTTVAYPVTANAYQPVPGACLSQQVCPAQNLSDNDAIVTMLDTTQSGSNQLVYSSYLGGNSYDFGYGIAVGSNGNIAIAGSTRSYSNTVSSQKPFPTTANALQTNSGATGILQGFVAVLNPFASTGNASLIYSSYLGGNNETVGNGVAMDSTNNVYVAGYTYSSNFSTTTNAYDPTYLGAGGGNGEYAFVTELKPSAAGASGLLYSTYLGGGNKDYGQAIQVNGDGRIYVAGGTESANFPTTANAYQKSYGGSGRSGYGDAFLTVLDPSQAITTNQLAYSTYFGGSGDEYLFGNQNLAVDKAGYAYLFASTTSTNLPTTADALDSVNNVSQYHTSDGVPFLAKLNTHASGASSLLYSTYIGGNTTNQNAYGSDGFAIVVDPEGNAFASGASYDVLFPTTSGAYQQQGQAENNAYAFKLALTQLGFSTQPTNTLQNAAFTTTVSLYNNDGSVYTAYNGPITLTINSGTLNGTTTVTATNGVATFANLSVSVGGTNFILTAAAPNLTPVVSAPFNVAGAVSSLTVSPASLTFSTTVGSNPASQNLTLNAISNTLGYNSFISYTSGTSGWLSVTPVSSTITPGTPVTATANVNSSSLTAGTYTALINFSNTSYVTDSVKTIPVTLTVMPSSYTYYLPFVANNANNFTTYLAFQNIGSATANVTINYYDTSGNALSAATIVTQVAKYGEAIPSNPLASGNTGAGIITSDQPLNVIVPEATPYGGSAYAVPSGSSNSLIAPFALNNAFGDFTTQLNIFNGGSSAVTATVTFYGTVGSSTAITSTSTSVNIAAHTTKNLNQSTLPNGFSGWAQISGTANTLVAQVLEQSPGTKFVAIANAIANPSATEYAPAIFNNGYGGFYTGANIINPNSSAVTVTVTYYDLSANQIPTTPFVIPAYGVASIFNGGTSGSGLPSGGLPSGFIGSVAVSAIGGNIAMSVNENGGLTATGNSRSGTYAAIASGGSTVGLPVVSNGGYTYTTGDTILNTSSSPVTATITYYDLSGNSTGVSKTFTVAGHGSQAYYQGDGSLPSNFYGTAVITETSGPANSLIATTNAQSIALFYTYSEPNS